jgi:hypothetical protein
MSPKPRPGSTVGPYLKVSMLVNTVRHCETSRRIIRYFASRLSGSKEKFLYRALSKKNAVTAAIDVLSRGGSPGKLISAP